MLYAIHLDRHFYRVGRQRYYSVLGLGDLITAPWILLHLFVVGYGAYLVAAILGLVPFSLSVQHPAKGMMGAVALGLLFPWVFAVFRILRILSVRKPRGDVDLLVSASGLQILRAGKVAGSIAWETIVRGVRLRDGVLLLQKGHLYQWLPDSALRNAVPVDVVELLRSHVALDVRA